MTGRARARALRGPALGPSHTIIQQKVGRRQVAVVEGDRLARGQPPRCAQRDAAARGRLDGRVGRPRMIRHVDERQQRALGPPGAAGDGKGAGGDGGEAPREAARVDRHAAERVVAGGEARQPVPRKGREPGAPFQHLRVEGRVLLQGVDARLGKKHGQPRHARGQRADVWRKGGRLPGRPVRQQSQRKAPAPELFGDGGLEAEEGGLARRVGERRVGQQKPFRQRHQRFTRRHARRRQQGVAEGRARRADGDAGRVAAGRADPARQVGHRVGAGRRRRRDTAAAGICW